MSILTDLFAKKITFHQAAAEAEAWAAQLVAHDPVLASTAGALLSDVKQAASDAVNAADSALGAFIGPAATATALALDTAFAAATHGASVPFNKFTEDGVKRIADAVRAEADAWTLRVTAQLAAATPPVTPPA